MRGRFAPLAQAPLLAFSFEFTFDLNFKKNRVAVTSPKPPTPRSRPARDTHAHRGTSF